MPYLSRPCNYANDKIRPALDDSNLHELISVDITKMWVRAFVDWSIAAWSLNVSVSWRRKWSVWLKLRKKAATIAIPRSKNGTTCLHWAVWALCWCTTAYDSWQPVLKKHDNQFFYAPTLQWPVPSRQRWDVTRKLICNISPMLIIWRGNWNLEWEQNYENELNDQSWVIHMQYLRILVLNK